jgi:glycine oxidase
MTAVRDVLIIGGGAIGLGIAWRLAKRGAGVTVIDRGPMAGEASSNAAGMLVPLAEAHGPGAFLDLCLESSRLYAAFAEALLTQSGVDIELGRAGTLHVAVGKEGADALARSFAWLRTLPFNVEWLGAAGVRSREPNLNPDVSAGVFVPSEGWVTPPKLAEALSRAAANAGVRLLPDHQLLSVEWQGSRVTAVRAGGERLAADRFVVAAGPWSREVGQQFGLTIPVFPVRGQLIALNGESAPFRHVLFGRGVYLVRWLSGNVIVGSTMDYAGFVKEVTAEGMAGLLNAAIELVPGLAGCAVRRAWACLRPGTPDELPILGPAPGLDNVFIATGHFRNGVLLTPITADLMADVIQGKPPLIPLSPFRPDRPALQRPAAVA